jgi:O-antigen/teichoic acid export membrane protein
MRAERRIFINTALLGIGEVVGQLANFAFVVLLARRFGVAIFGWYSFAMALGAVLAPFVSLGGSMYLTRELAREPARAAGLFAALRPVQLSSGLLVWLVMALTALAADIDTAGRQVIVIVGAYHVLLRMAALYLAPSAAREQMLATAVVGGGHRIVVAALAATAIVLGFDAPVALLAMPASALLSLVAARVVADREARSRFSATEAIERMALVRASLPFLGTALLAVIYVRGGILLLTGLRGEVDTGLFSMADRLLVPIYMITGTFAAAVFPAMTRLTGEPARMRELSRRCVRLVLTVTIPLAGALAICATDVTTIVFGSRAHAAAPVLAALAPLAVLRSLSSLWFGHCLAIDKEHRAVVAKARAVVAFFILAAAGIAALGAIGLAIATVLAELYLAWSLGRLLADHAQYEPVWPASRAVVAAAVCAALIVVFIPSLALPTRVVLVLAVMAVVTLLLGGIQGHDLRFLRAILRGGGSPGALGERRPPALARGHEDD